jgi:hypothetical protein
MVLGAHSPGRHFCTLTCDIIKQPGPTVYPSGSVLNLADQLAADEAWLSSDLYFFHEPRTFSQDLWVHSASDDSGSTCLNLRMFFDLVNDLDWFGASLLKFLDKDLGDEIVLDYGT